MYTAFRRAKLHPRLAFCFTALATVIAAATLTGCNTQPQGGGEAPPPPQVTVATPEERAITDWDEFTARIAAVEAVEVRARVSGYLESVDFTDGDTVEQGELLFVVDPRPFEAAVAQAEAVLQQAQVSAQLADNDLERAKDLFNSRAISEEEFDARTQNVQSARSAVKAADAALTQSRLDLEFTRVKAPISGRTSRALVTRGNLISGGQSNATLLTTIVSRDPVYAYFTAAEDAYLKYQRLAQSGDRPSSRVAPNPLRLKVSDEDGYIHIGAMDFVDNVVDSSTGTIEGRGIFPNPDGILIPGLFAKVQLQGRGPYPALLIPDTAIGTDQSRQFVYVLDDQNMVSQQVITPGRLTEDGLRVVEAGLTAESRFILTGLQRVRPGMVVSPSSATDQQGP
ncbi:MAG: efflux RND transporter periplasmic adaptor subunit [Pseudomonadota bacterium]